MIIGIYQEISRCSPGLQGIGLAEQGATVVISARKQDQLDKAATQIITAVGADRAMPVACNVGHKDQLQALVDAAHDRPVLVAC